MDKLELLKLAAEIYPCPPFEGDMVNIKFTTDVRFVDVRYVLTYIDPNASIFSIKHIHVIKWVKRICDFVNISFMYNLDIRTKNE